MAIVVNCEQDREVDGPSTSSSGGSSSSGGNGGEDSSLNCALPSECRGDNCCHTDKKCIQWCGDNDYLDLSSEALKKCKNLDKDIVEDIVHLFNNVFQKPSKAKLSDLNEEDMDLACAAVKELDHDILADRIDDYTSSISARRVLEWLAERPSALEIFEAAEGDEGVEMLKTVLQKASNKTGNQGIINGLSQIVDNNDNRHTLAIAIDGENNNLITFIHENIILDKDDGICRKKTDILPRANDCCWGNSLRSPPSYTPAETAIADRGYKKEACILAVYCKISNYTDVDFMREIAELLNEDDVVDFIKETKANGGLTLSANDVAQWTRVNRSLLLSKDDAEQWTPAACNRLKLFWNNPKVGTQYLDLGLGYSIITD